MMLIVITYLCGFSISQCLLSFVLLLSCIWRLHGYSFLVLLSETLAIPLSVTGEISDIPLNLWWTIPVPLISLIIISYEPAHYDLLLLIIPADSITAQLCLAETNITMTSIIEIVLHFWLTVINFTYGSSSVQQKTSP